MKFAKDQDRLAALFANLQAETLESLELSSRAQHSSVNGGVVAVFANRTKTARMRRGLRTRGRRRSRCGEQLRLSGIDGGDGFDIDRRFNELRP